MICMKWLFMYLLFDISFSAEVFFEKKAVNFAQCNENVMKNMHLNRMFDVTFFFLSIFHYSCPRFS